jgi:hypothetical protein
MQRRIRIGEVLCEETFYQAAVATKIREKKGREPVEEITYEKFKLFSPSSYVISLLRKRVKKEVSRILSGERNKVSLSLERWPQVATVMGEIKSSTKKNLSFGYTSKDEENTLFVIELVHKK